MRDRLLRMVNTVHRRLGDPGTVAELAAASSLNVSASHFGRLCVEHLGKTPMQIVACLRMERVAEALRETDDSLGVLPDRMGYATPFALSAAFKKYFGKSPRDYRKSGEPE